MFANSQIYFQLPVPLDSASLKQFLLRLFQNCKMYVLDCAFILQQLIHPELSFGKTSACKK